MAKRRASKAPGFRGPAHVATLGIGQCVKTKSGPCAGKVSAAAVDRQARALATATGGTTSIRGNGRYKHDDGTWANEPSTLIQTMTNGAQSCERFKRVVRGVAAGAARQLRQEAVLVVVQCAGKAVDASYVGSSGKANDLYPMPAPTQRKALGMLRRR